MSRIEDIEYPFPETIRKDVPIKKDASPYSIHFFRYRYSETSDLRHMFWLCAKSDKCYAYIFPIRIYKDAAEFFENHLEKTMHAFQEHIAYPAFELLRQNTSEFAKENIGELDEVSIADYYEKEMYALLFDEIECKKANISSVKDIIPHLFYHGFCYLKDAHAYKQVDIVENSEYDIIAKRLDISPTEENEKEQQADKRSLATGGKLTIQPISKDLRNQAYIEELFGDLLIQKLHPVMRFHLLYQVIELIINKIGLIFNNAGKDFGELSKKIGEMGEDIQFFQTLKEISDVASKISSITLKSEVDRIDILFENCLSRLVRDKYDKLCKNSILGTTNLTPKDIGKVVYKLRNKIVHSYYHISNKSETLTNLQEVNLTFEKLIAEVVVSLDISKVLIPSNPKSK